MPEIFLWKTGRYCFVHCAGEDSSARKGEDGIKKCRTGVSPLSPEKTMEKVSAGFGVAFPGKYESGDVEEDYEDMEDDPFVFPSSSPIRHSTTGQRHRVVKWKK